MLIYTALPLVIRPVTIPDHYIHDQQNNFPASTLSFLSFVKTTISDPNQIQVSSLVQCH